MQLTTGYHRIKNGHFSFKDERSTAVDVTRGSAPACDNRFSISFKSKYRSEIFVLFYFILFVYVKKKKMSRQQQQHQKKKKKKKMT
jgi:hypothetical protein